jgi:hypothetical protein
VRSRPFLLTELLNRHQAICRHSLRLALEPQRLDLLDCHRVPYEPVRRLAEQDFERRRSLFEPRRGVDGVTGH